MHCSWLLKMVISFRTNERSAKGPKSPLCTYLLLKQVNFHIPLNLRVGTEKYVHYHRVFIIASLVISLVNFRATVYFTTFRNVCNRSWMQCHSRRWSTGTLILHGPPNSTIQVDSIKSILNDSGARSQSELQDWGRLVRKHRPNNLCAG